MAEDLFNRALDEPDLEIREKVNILCALAWLTAAGRGSLEAIQYAEAGLRLAEQAADPGRSPAASPPWPS